MIDRDALEEEPIGDLLRTITDLPLWQGTLRGEELRQIAHEADRRERNWRELYASMEQQRDNALATLAIVNGGDFEKDFEEMKRTAEGRNG